MASPSSENNATNPSSAPVQLAAASVDLSSPSSTATTLTSQTDSQTPSNPPRRANRPFHFMQTHDEDSVTNTESSSLASSATIQEGSMSTAQRKVLQIKRDMYKEGADMQHATKGLFKQAYSTDLLFLIDATFSMRPYIDAAKDQVKSIIEDVKTAFFDEAEIRIAVVTYRDHYLGDKNVQWLDFTSSVDEVHTFLGNLTVAHGSDFPEDVLGGLNQALEATWKHQTRCVIHIGDAPPHGVRYHDMTAKQDDYPAMGSEPHHLTLEPLLDRAIKLNINYALLTITNHTDKMASIMYEKYAAAKAACKARTENKYAAKMPVLTGTSKNGAAPTLVFEESKLGTEFSALRHLVIKNVTQSASLSAIRMVSSKSKSTKLAGWTKGETALATIGEDDAPRPEMETAKPQWKKPGWLDQTFVLEGFSPDLSIDSSCTLDDMLQHEDNIKINAVELLIHKRSKPFAQGAMRLAYYARAQTMTDHFVVKSYKKRGKSFAHFAKDMQAQALCKAFALEFDSLLGDKIFDFIVTTCLKGRRRNSTGAEDEELLSLEPLIEGAYVKYNSNCGWVNEHLPHDESNKAAQAFSHFTYERSRGRLLVCDIQGVGGLLTDPAIHALDPDRFKLGDTNLGTDGFKFFFSTHVCNDVCQRLGLKSNTADMRRGVYDYRRDWPTHGDKFRCCSNKLCGRITRLPAGYDPKKPLRHHWCHTCYQQVRSSMERVTCEAAKPKHDFPISRFLCESQGLPLPRTCPEHRDKEAEIRERGPPSRKSSMAVSVTEMRESPVTTGGSFWSKMKAAGKKSSK